MYECLFFPLIACHSWDLNVRIQPAAVMLVGRRWWELWTASEERSRSPSLEGYWGEPFIPLWPLDLTVTPTKWTALLLKLFNCSLISFIILLIQISAVSSEWKICIAWIILTRGPFNFCQQYFTAPIKARSHWCHLPPGMSADSTLRCQITRERQRTLALAIIIWGGHALITTQVLGQHLRLSLIIYGLTELWGTISLFSPLNRQGKVHF